MHMKLHNFSFSIPSLYKLSEMILTEFRYKANDKILLQRTPIMMWFRSRVLYIVPVVSLIWHDT
ncbi:hypothetical protein HanIR_Chr09g0395991 [Helianthus annuus]|nr:hypothetical protein HanIR_Chr09g0395991 [Helianthus annuus]